MVMFDREALWLTNTARQRFDGAESASSDRITTVPALGQTAALFSIGLAAILVMGCDRSAEQPVRELKLGLVTDIEHSSYKAAVKFSDLVKERTRGKLVIKVYPNAVLAAGDSSRQLQMLGEGKVDFSLTSTVAYSNLDKRFFACSLPWLFSGYDAADKFLTGPVGRSVLDMTRDLGIEGLALGENGFRQITNSRRAIHTPDDLRGLRIRVPTEMFAPVYRSLGAQPEFMKFTATYQALHDRTMDGQENPTDLIVAHRYYDVQKFVTIWNHSYDAFIFGVNRSLFNSLDRKTQEVLRQTALEAAAYETNLARESAKMQIDILKEKGMEVTELTSGEVKAFRAKVEPVYAAYEPIIGKQLLDSLRNLDNK